MMLLFIAMDDDKRAHPEYLFSEAAVLDAVKRTVFDYQDGAEWDADHIREAEGITATLLEDGSFHFEGDAPLHLFRLPDSMTWTQAVKATIRDPEVRDQLLAGKRPANTDDQHRQREIAAREIYDGWKGQPGWVPWVEGGNSLWQDRARSYAHAALSKRIKEVLGGQRIGCEHGTIGGECPWCKEE